MNNIYKCIKQRVINTLDNYLTQNKIENKDTIYKIRVEATKSHGEIATNAAFVLSKTLCKPPVSIAERLVELFSNIEEVQYCTIAGGGFINFTLKKQVWQEIIPVINEHGTSFGDANLGNGEKVNLEFVSANPTGPLHIGHARGAIIGDALANLLRKVGFDTTKEYYINDLGKQIEHLTHSVYLRYKEALGYEIEINAPGLYPGTYLQPLGKELVELYHDKLLKMPENAWFPLVKKYALTGILDLIKQNLALLKVDFDVFVSESMLHERDYLQKSLQVLHEKSLIYIGTLPPPKGTKDTSWQSEKHYLFKAQLFGDEDDRVVQRNDLTYTYFTSDIAYHFYKLQRGFTQMIMLLGVDHHGYVKRLQAIARALSNDTIPLKIDLYNVVNFYRNGKQVKMSKRAGNFLSISQVIEEVGVDLTRFVILMRRNDMILDFDLVKVKEQSKNNPMFYIQYAYSRAHSIISQITEKTHTIDLSLLSSEGEVALIKALAQWPEVVETAALTRSLHHIGNYLYEVAELFHTLWSYGNKNPYLRFIIQDNGVLTTTRLSLVTAVANVIASGLKIFNITPMKRM